jgi:GNAT superfamily N-acetyltransferase
MKTRFTSTVSLTDQRGVTATSQVGTDNVPIGHVSRGVASDAVTQSLQGPIVERSRPDSDAVEVIDLLVDPCHRVPGIGGLLLDAAVQALRDAGRVPVIACGMDDETAFLLCHSRGLIIGGRSILADDGGFYSMTGTSHR